MNRIDWTFLAGAELIGTPPAEVNGVYYDSRAVTPGSLFVAVPGALPRRSLDGHDFIEAALKAGASAIVVQNDCQAKWQPFVDRASAAFVAVDDTRRALATLARCFLSRV